MGYSYKDAIKDFLSMLDIIYYCGNDPKLSDFSRAIEFLNPLIVSYNLKIKYLTKNGADDEEETKEFFSEPRVPKLRDLLSMVEYLTCTPDITFGCEGLPPRLPDVFSVWNKLFKIAVELRPSQDYKF